MTGASTSSGRRTLAGRSGETVDRLLEAGLEVLREHGYEQLSMREVCRRAGLTHATAYGYFSAKQHLVSEIYWRRVQQWCETPVVSGTQQERLAAVFAELAELAAAEPELSVAASAAVLSRDPDVARVRTLIGTAMNGRVRLAAGPGCSEDVLDALGIAVSGAMVQAGMGYSTYQDMALRLTRVARLLLPTDSPER
ncbi:TetR/AcrR family transcriptional regulator [Nocardia fluminea]|jgi:AcrR family transcriptional regulator|uniref:TetR family transcriptional regulator n=1 Tax=Nocardia fluminea TaxID=134984 RepID=A0A2N3WWV5_9NOCA|nr:helix-turn-helix domain-containing protein [Nocardia fluminea]PKV98359.1 TetR family transcriptional regulator [Nocardia fluminea]